MAKKKKRKGGKGASKADGNRKMLLHYGLPITAVLLVPLLLWLTGSFGHSTAISYDEVILVDEGHLLLVGSSGRDTDTNRAGRVAYLGPEGEVSWMVEEDGALRLLGIGREVIWMSSSELGIHGRSIQNLAIFHDTVGKVDGHAALRLKRRALGIAGEAIVLDGADGPYTLTADGTLEKQAKDFEYARLGRAGALGPDDLPLPAGCIPGSEQSQALARKLGDLLTEAHFLPCGRRRGFVSFDEPPGKLVTDTVYDAEARTRRLVRVDEQGEVLWATPMAELVAGAPFEEPGGLVTVLWAGFWSGKLRALVQSFRSEVGDYDGGTTTYYTVEHRLVVVDHATGKPTSVTAVVLPEE